MHADVMIGEGSLERFTFERWHVAVDSIKIPLIIKKKKGPT